jgi:hypothetical protein
VEVETTIQPIPINDGLGKELIVRYTTNFATNSLFWTDSMGQEFQQRQRNYRPTWNLTWTNEPVPPSSIFFFLFFWAYCGLELRARRRWHATTSP